FREGIQLGKETASDVLLVQQAALTRLAPNNPLAGLSSEFGRIGAEVFQRCFADCRINFLARFSGNRLGTGGACGIVWRNDFIGFGHMLLSMYRLTLLCFVLGLEPAHNTQVTCGSIRAWTKTDPIKQRLDSQCLFCGFVGHAYAKLA